MRRERRDGSQSPLGSAPLAKLETFQCVVVGFLEQHGKMRHQVFPKNLGGDGRRYDII